MSEHKIGEQWVEEIDGKQHMLKAVDSTYNCNGCAYLCDNGKCSHESIIECPVYRIDAIIRDLGPVNKEGLLPCPFCGDFPTIKEELDENDESIYSVEHECEAVVITTGWNHDKQECIDAWNRRN